MSNDETTRVALSVPEAAAAMGISRAGLYALLARGEGPPTIKLGRRRLIRRDALQEWLRKQEETEVAA